MEKARQRKQRLLDLVVDGTLDRQSYRTEADRTETRMTEPTLDLEALSVPDLDLAETLDFGVSVLRDAARHWRRFEPKARREFQILLFPQGVTYSPAGEFETRETCLLFNGEREWGGKGVVALLGANWNSVVEEMDVLRRLRAA